MEERCRLRVPENCCDLSLSKSTSRLRELLVDWSIFSRSVAYSTCGEGGREELKLEEGSSGSVNRLQVYHCVCVSARARACVCVCVCNHDRHRGGGSAYIITGKDGYTHTCMYSQVLHLTIVHLYKQLTVIRIYV